MRGRSNWTEQERDTRSRLMILVHEQDFIAGTIVTMNRVCGKPGCHCAKGKKKHRSLYLAFNKKGKRTKDRKVLAHTARARTKKRNGNLRKWKRTMQNLGTKAEKLWQKIVKCYVNKIIELSLESKILDFISKPLRKLAKMS